MNASILRMLQPSGAYIILDGLRLHRLRQVPLFLTGQPVNAWLLTRWSCTGEELQSAFLRFWQAAC